MSLFVVIKRLIVSLQSTNNLIIIIYSTKREVEKSTLIFIAFAQKLSQKIKLTWSKLETWLYYYDKYLYDQVEQCCV